MYTVCSISLRSTIIHVLTFYYHTCTYVLLLYMYLRSTSIHVLLNYTSREPNHKVKGCINYRCSAPFSWLFQLHRDGLFYWCRKPPTFQKSLSTFRPEGCHRKTRSLFLSVCFVDRYLSFCPFFIWPLCCLSFFDIRSLIASLVSSNSSLDWVLLCIEGYLSPWNTRILKFDISFVKERVWWCQRSNQKS